jgi:hypothetical protein
MDRTRAAFLPRGRAGARTRSASRSGLPPTPTRATTSGGCASRFPTATSSCAPSAGHDACRARAPPPRVRGPNVGSDDLHGVRLSVERPWRLHGASPAYTVAPGRTLSGRHLRQRHASAPAAQALRVRPGRRRDVDGATTRSCCGRRSMRVGDSGIRGMSARGLRGHAAGRVASSGMSAAKLRVARVDVAVVRRVGKTARGCGRPTAALRGSCSRPLWLRARGTRHWAYRLNRAFRAAKLCGLQPRGAFVRGTRKRHSRGATATGGPSGSAEAHGTAAG